jgi:uncharacterized protein
MSNLTLKILDGNYTIHRFGINEMGLPKIQTGSFYSYTKSEDEISIVCDSEIVMNNSKQEFGWKVIKLIGPFAFTQVGIIAGITRVFAEKQISVFVISTFDTDYILVKKENLDSSIEALKLSGYLF